MRQYYPLVALASAQLSAVRGEWEAALQEYTRCEELAIEMLMRPLVWQARAGASQALSSLGRAAEAEAK